MKWNNSSRVKLSAYDHLQYPGIKEIAVFHSKREINKKNPQAEADDIGYQWQSLHAHTCVLTHTHVYTPAAVCPRITISRALSPEHENSPSHRPSHLRLVGHQHSMARPDIHLPQLPFQLVIVAKLRIFPRVFFTFNCVEMFSVFNILLLRR